MTKWLILFNDAVLWYYAVAVSFYVLLIASALWSSAAHRRRLLGQSLRAFLDSPLTPPVSILVPAYNEELSLAESVRSLLRLRYPEFEVVVINDGSKDGTLEALKTAFGLVPTRIVVRPAAPHQPIRATYVSPSEPRLLVIDKVNGGKSDALNAGLNVARSPYFCAIDADAVLEPDALVRVMAPLLNERDMVVAAGGIVRVINGSTVRQGEVLRVGLPASPVETLQVIEYLRGFLFGREGWSALNTLLIISGAFGVFSRRLALELGGYRRDTVGEDMDLVVRMHRHLRERRQAYRIVFVPDPVCWTEVPGDLRTLARQRRRWQKGLLDVLWRHRRMFGNPRYGLPGMVGLPYQLVVELVGPVMELLGIVSMAAAAWLGILDRATLLAYLAFSYLAGTAISVAAILLEELTYRRYQRISELVRLLGYAFLDFFPYRQFLMAARLLGMWDYLFGSRHTWGAQKRAGFAAARLQ
jgi:cellulose synthase/poly-beta-1,6-N-acetylglucosamine synthase-like glycosyltransferase